MPGFASILDALAHWAAAAPNDRAYLFLADRGTPQAELTFALLHERALAVAVELRARSARPGDRALLVFPPGLEFLVGFLGCLFAGVIAVPMMPPRRAALRDASSAIIADCRPRFALSSEKFVLASRADLATRPELADVTWVTVNISGSAAPSDASGGVSIDSGALAFLQYTSGSTSTPKGVMVAHDNLVHNLEMIKEVFGTTRRSTCVSWVPLHHDMGLILNCLESLYVGAACILMSPTLFLQRPLSWLRAISEYGAEIAGGPNFAFDHCIARFQPEHMQGIDLSRWQVAFNAAEPIQADTLARFASTFAPYGFNSKAFHPCYGMAEATVLVSGGSRGKSLVVRSVSQKAMQALRVADPADDKDAFRIVGCGRAVGEEQLAIVDPESWRRLDADEVGEIWVCGPNVGRGYWQNEPATVETFSAMIVDESSGPWLRTGDLGFLDKAGELFITGRIKDIIIVRGINYYPQDIEQAVQSASPVFRPGHGAAFSILDSKGSEKVVVVQEIERTQRWNIDPDELRATAREAVVERHDLFLHEIVLLRPGTIPKTTSGKIQRRLTRQLWQAGKLDVVGAKPNPQVAG